jgi:sugar phosphate isomerase/epimerase
MSWRIGISTGACADCPILDILPVIRASGTAGVELGTPPRHFDPWQDAQIDAVSAYLGRSGLEAISIHAPFGAALDLADPNPHHRHAAIGAILTAAAALRRCDGRLVVVHPSDLERHRHDAPARLADSARSLALLAANLDREGQTLVVESPLPHLIGGHPDEFAWLLQELPESVRVCLDTGHTWLGHFWHRFVDIAGARLAHVHAHDHHGRRDDHLPPGEGLLDWPEIVRTLEAAGFNGWIMLELAAPKGDAASYFRAAFERASVLLADPRLAPAS